MKRKGVLSVLVLLLFGILMDLCIISHGHAKSEKVLAKVGNIIITQEDLQEMMGRYSHFRKGKPYTLEEKKKLLDLLVKWAFIAMEAEKEKLDETPEVRSKMKLYKGDLLTQKYVASRIEPFATVKDEEVEQYFKDHPKLVFVDDLHIREIVVEKEEEAKQIMEELKKGGDFGEIATKKSITRFKMYGGKRVIQNAGVLPLPEEDLALSLKAGEIGGPIQLDNSYCIIKLEERKVRPKEEVEKEKEKLAERIFSGLKNEKIQAVLEKKFEELKKGTKIEIYYDHLQ